VSQGDPKITTAGRVRFWLEYAGRRLPVDPGTYVVGRSTGAELVLDDALVSRRHAQFVVTEDAIRVEDLGSVNGLFVNGERVNGERKLVAGDCVVVGKQELVVGASMTTSDRPREVGRFTADTLVGLEPEPRADSDSESTHQGDALELLGGVADKVLALGRGDEAERILASYLKNLMETVNRTGVEPAIADKAVVYAVKLGAATKKGEWIDYAFEMYTRLHRPLPAPVVDELFTVLRHVHGVSLPKLRAYVAELRSLAPRLGPADRFLAQRIEGLERLAASK
jgi:pSer/pThr/pTyr-binding forkhead associated (FHA) protein